MLDEDLERRSVASLTARYANVQRQFRASERSSRRTRTGLQGALLACVAGLAYCAWNMNRLAEKAEGREVVYAVLQDNGEFVTSTHASEVVPVNVQGREIESALWGYVEARDCYGSSSFYRQYYMVQSMSDEHTAKQFRAIVANTNPDRPQHILGEHNLTIRCEPIDAPTPLGEHSDQYLFHFNRWLVGGPPGTDVKEPYTATLRFRTGEFPHDKRRAWLDPVLFNPLGVQVIDYPGALPTNATPPAVHVAANQGAAR